MSDDDDTLRFRRDPDAEQSADEEEGVIDATVDGDVDGDVIEESKEPVRTAEKIKVVIASVLAIVALLVFAWLILSRGEESSTPENAEPLILGETCSKSSECLSGLVCLDGTCSKFPVGEACNAGSDCQSGTCPAGRCTLGIFQDECARDRDCLNANCVEGKCSISSEGEWCSEDDGCDTSYCDVSNNKCELASCETDGGCRSGVCRQGFCVDGGFKSFCDQNSDCKSDYCLDGMCAESKEGDWCENDQGCLDGICLHGKCSPPSENGETCELSRKCASGYCDDMRVCAEKKRIGDACKDHGDCVGGAFCNPESETCAPRLGAGEDCEIIAFGTTADARLSVCEEGFCSAAYTCVPFFRENEECLNPQECEPKYLFCSKDRICIARKTEGEICEADTECISKNCDGPPGSPNRCKPT